MKKFLFTFVMLMSVVTMSFASGKTTDSDAETFRDRILNTVRNEGYVPSLADDGDVKFKKEGVTYWISVEAYKNGYYVKLYTGSTSEASMYNCLYNANKVMCDYKFLQINTVDSDGTHVLIVAYDWYCTTLAQFEQMFSSAMSVVSSAKQDLDQLIN